MHCSKVEKLLFSVNFCFIVFRGNLEKKKKVMVTAFSVFLKQILITEELSCFKCINLITCF